VIAHASPIILVPSLYMFGYNIELTSF
jgi:hypothetical protein